MNEDRPVVVKPANCHSQKARIREKTAKERLQTPTSRNAKRAPAKTDRYLLP